MVPQERLHTLERGPWGQTGLGQHGGGGPGGSYQEQGGRGASDKPGIHSPPPTTTEQSPTSHGHPEGRWGANHYAGMWPADPPHPLWLPRQPREVLRSEMDTVSLLSPLGPVSLPRPGCPSPLPSHSLQQPPCSLPRYLFFHGHQMNLARVPWYPDLSLGAQALSVALSDLPRQSKISAQRPPPNLAPEHI